MQFRRELGKAQAHFFSVWKNLFEGDSLPQKQAIGIRDLRHYVAHYAVIHLDEQGTVSMLHSGTGFDELWGRNISGCAISDLVPAKSVDLLNWFFRSMMAQPCGGHTEEIFTKKTGDRYQLDVLYLPVRKKDGTTALAANADVKILGPMDYIHLQHRLEEEAQIIHYADFIDVGYGIPEGYFES